MSNENSLQKKKNKPSNLYVFNTIPSHHPQTRSTPPPPLPYHTVPIRSS